MKNVFKTFLILAIAFMAWNTSALACGSTNVTLAGPSGECVEEGTPLTYVGKHNFSSLTGCTYYEWTIAGGTITGPTGVSVTDGTLCLSSAASCTDWGDNCTAVAVFSGIAFGDGTPVTVVWNTPASNRGTLSLRVEVVTLNTEGQEINLVDDASLSIDNSAIKPITGPSGDCVAEGVPLTYIGSHDFPSVASCTYYEWTIEGGTVTGGPTGISVTDGTLCLSHNVACTDWGFACTQTTVVGGTGLLLGTGTPVTVVWNTPASGKGKLSLKVKVITADAEGNKVKRERKTEIKIDNSARKPNFIVRTNIGNNSSTFTADLPDDSCEGTIVNWTLDGQPAGTGNPINLPVGRCESAEVCAFTTLTGATSDPLCTFFGTDVQPGSISGPDQVALEQVANFSLNGSSAPGISNVLWTIRPNQSGQILNGQGSTSISTIFFNPSVSFVDVCVSGDWECGTFDICKRVFISGGGLKAPNDDPTKLRPFITSNEDYQSLKAFPSLLKAGRELTINLPTYDQMVDLTITDIQGRVVFQNRTDQAQVLFNTAGLSKGMYVVSVSSIAGLESQKIIIE